MSLEEYTFEPNIVMFWILNKKLWSGVLICWMNEPAAMKSITAKVRITSPKLNAANINDLMGEIGLRAITWAYIK